MPAALRYMVKDRLGHTKVQEKKGTRTLREIDWTCLQRETRKEQYEERTKILMANVEGQRHEGAQQNHWHVWLTVQPRVLVGGREALFVAIPTKGRVSGQLSMGRIAIPRLSW